MIKKEDKEYYTEPQRPVGANPIDERSPNPMLTKIPETPESSSRELTVVSSHPSFVFEKNKLQNVNIGPSYQTDVNDENIQKLRSDILRQCQGAIGDYDKYSAFLKALAIALISVNIIEIIGFFFLLLVLSMQYVPYGHIVMWIGVAMLLCLSEIYSSIKAINSTQEQTLEGMNEFVRISALLVCLFLFFVVLLILSLCGVVLGATDSMSAGQAGKLVLVQGILLGITVLKLAAQVAFVWFGLRLRRQLFTVSGDQSARPIN